MTEATTAATQTTAAQPSEQDLQAAYEAELERLTSAEMIVQTAASLLNLGARRLGLTGGRVGTESERDREQVRDAIDAVRALLPVLERRMAPGELRPLRDALSQLQMAYAREAQPAPAAADADRPAGEAAPPGPPASGAPAGAGGHGGAGAPGGAAPSSQPSGPGPAESSGRLWVPGR